MIRNILANIRAETSFRGLAGEFAGLLVALAAIIGFFAIASPGDPVVTATNTPRSAAVDAGHTGSGL